MTGDAPEPGRRVRRGGGEVTEWPRGLTEYVPVGPPDAAPSPEEDPLVNRLRLASRLLAVLRSQGLDVSREVAELRAADQLLTLGDRARAAGAIDGLLAGLDARRPPPTPP